MSHLLTLAKDPDEEKLNHRIPHRFEPLTNIGANWCCHCGYILPLGKKNARKCTGKIHRFSQLLIIQNVD